MNRSSPPPFHVVRLVVGSRVDRLVQHGRISDATSAVAVDASTTQLYEEKKKEKKISSS